jgi:hypothetical protein
MKRLEAFTAASGRGGAATERPTRACRLAVGILLSAACLLAVACTQEPPRHIGLGDEIAVGPYALEIVRARKAPNPPPPISTFRSQPRKRCIVVSVYWKTLADLDAIRRIVFVESFLENQLSIADAEGKRTKAFGAMQEKLMFMEDPGPNWRNWVVVFHVSDESRDLALLVENPEPREGQARFTSTPLGM